MFDSGLDELCILLDVADVRTFLAVRNFVACIARVVSLNSSA
jgi:hypothetical protein